MNKIPVGRTVAEAYRFAFAGVERVIGVIWLPALTLAVGGYFVTGPYLTGMADALEAGDLGQQGPLWARMFAFELVSVVLLAVMAVAITREILDPLKRPLFLRFGLGATEFRLVGALVGLYVLLLVFAIVCAILAVVLGFVLDRVLPGAVSLTSAAGARRGLGLAALVGLCLSPVLIYVFARLSFLVVPSVVMEGRFGLERSWQLTRGNVLRIIAIGLAVGLPITLVSFAAQAAVLGLDAFNPHFELIGDQAAQAHQTVEQLRHTAANLPLLMAVEFVLLPFTCGLGFAAPAFAYRALASSGQ